MTARRPLPAEVAVYKSDNWLSLDFETTNKEYGSALNHANRVVMAAWQAGGGPVMHHYGNLLEARGFWDALEGADFVIAHNAKFEAHWLARLGYDPTDLIWFDTLLAEKVRLGNRRAPLDLGAVCARYGYPGKEGVIDGLLKGGVCPADMPKERLIARCRRDVRTTAQVAQKLIAGLEREGKLAVAYTRCLLTPVLAQIERQGMKLDPARVEEEYISHVKRAVDLAAEVKEITGGINPRSSDQMAVFLYQTLKFPEPKDKRGRPLRNAPDKPKKDGTQKWPQGKPRTDQNTMLWLEGKAKTKRQKRFIELRREYGKVNAALSKNLEFFKGVCEEREGAIFYGQFNQASTGTHRLSSAGLPQAFTKYNGKEKSVQFQNMPRAFKRLFETRDPDYLMVEADGAQLEFRVAAYLGQDATAIADIRNPEFDAHIQTAAVLNERAEAELLAEYRAGSAAAKEQRQTAKADTFKPLYGGQTGTPEQERYYRWFQYHYCDLYRVQEGWVSDVLAKGRLVTPWGLRFYWDFYLSHDGRPMQAGKSIVPSIFNYPVQSLATAEIIPIALVALYRRVKAAGLRVLLVNTVHDSVVAEVHKEDLEAFKAAVKAAFTADVYDYLSRVYGLEFNVPLGCEIKWGTHWGDGKGIKFDVEPQERLKEAA